MQALQDFETALYKDIPLVKNMQLKLQSISTHCLNATAPLGPNINDKSTVFGGSSAALMTICGWSLIKYQLQSKQLDHDVVIHKSKVNWDQAQHDDLIIVANIDQQFDWAVLIDRMKHKNRSTRINIHCAVLNQANQICSRMTGSYVVLKK